jgi:ribosome maturation factor RimP
MSSTGIAHHGGIDRAALLRVVEPIVGAHGAELVDLEFRPERGGWVLRLFVEKEGAAERSLSTRDAAVSLELCAGISRDLSPALDVADLIPHAYQLEVSSPGVERPLRGERDFARFAGERVRLKLREALPVLDDEGDPGKATGGSSRRGHQRVVIGVLDGVEGGRVRVREGKRTLEAPLALIESARLVFEFGASSPPRGQVRRAPLAKRH